MAAIRGKVFNGTSLAARCWPCSFPRQGDSSSSFDDPPALMDPPVAKIFWDSLVGNIADGDSVEVAFIKLESSRVRGKKYHASLGRVEEDSFQ